MMVTRCVSIGEVGVRGGLRKFFVRGHMCFQRKYTERKKNREDEFFFDSKNTTTTLIRQQREQAVADNGQERAGSESTRLSTYVRIYTSI